MKWKIKYLKSIFKRVINYFKISYIKKHLNGNNTLFKAILLYLIHISTKLVKFKKKHN